MSEQGDFIKAWRTWRRMPLPTRNARLGRCNAPTYAIELELDHLVSYVHATVDAFMGGKTRDHRVHVGDYLETLHTIETDLADSPADESWRVQIQEFIDSARIVLHTLLRWITSLEQA